MLTPGSTPTPCPLTETRRWHQHHAARHRAHLPLVEPEPGALVTARCAWHRGWAEWHQQQAEWHQQQAGGEEI